MKKFNRAVGILIATALLSMLGACASVANKGNYSINDAGITNIEAQPVIGTKDDVTLGEHYHAVFGKEYGAFTMDMNLKDGHVTDLKVTANDVKAFAGQEAASKATVAIQESLSKLGVDVTKEVSTVVAQAVLKAVGVP